MDRIALRTQLAAEAIRLGFDACGVSAPDAALTELDNLTAWLGRGYQARMDYLERQPAGRCNAESLLAGCRSVIVVAQSYATDDEAGFAAEPYIARYARGLDYHTVLGGKLQRLAEWLSGIAPGQRCKVTVDSSPIMEKAIALSAGIGWRGANSLVLNERLGSYFLLGTLLTTVSIEPDAPVPDGCGACRACMEACPTGALVARGVLDAGRCLSYKTSSRQGEAGPGDNLHGCFFGCDICQQACPYNTDCAEGTEPALLPVDAMRGLCLEELLALGEDAFSRRFTGTCAYRYGLWRLQRNARLLLGDGQRRT